MNQNRKMLSLTSARPHTLLCAAGLTGAAIALGGFAFTPVNAADPATDSVPCPASACGGCADKETDDTNKATASSDTLGSAPVIAAMAQAGTRGQGQRQRQQEREDESVGQNNTRDNDSADQSNRGSAQVFAAALQGLNIDANDGKEADGMAVVVIEDGNITIWMRVDGLAGDSEHRAMIYTGDTCPDPEQDDRNNDGTIDITEVIPTLGAVLIPIDTNLAEQMAGNAPKSNSSGLLVYQSQASYDALLADLQQPDPNPRDPVIKLTQGQTLDLEGLVLVVHGVGTDRTGRVPDTANTLLGLPATATLPVACGTLQRVQ